MRLILAASLVLLATIAVSAADSTPDPSPTAPSTPTPQPTPTAAPAAADDSPGYSELLTLFSAFAAAASATAAGIAARSTRRLERPWVVVIPKSPPDQLDPPAPDRPATLAMPYELANMGRSPAWILDDFVKAEVVPWPEVPTDRPCETVSNGAMIIPLARDGRAFPNRYPQVTLSEAECHEVSRGPAAILVHGQIHYRDVFMRKRVHAFGWLYVRADLAVWPDVVILGGNNDFWEWSIFPAPASYSKGTT